MRQLWVTIVVSVLRSPIRRTHGPNRRIFVVTLLVVTRLILVPTRRPPRCKDRARQVAVTFVRRKSPNGPFVLIVDSRWALFIKIIWVRRVRVPAIRVSVLPVSKSLVLLIIYILGRVGPGLISRVYSNVVIALIGRTRVELFNDPVVLVSGVKFWMAQFRDLVTR